MHNSPGQRSVLEGHRQLTKVVTQTHLVILITGSSTPPISSAKYCNGEWLKLRETVYKTKYTCLS